MSSRAERIAEAVLAVLTVPPLSAVPPERVYRDLDGALDAGVMPAVVVELGDEPEPNPGGTVIGRKLRRVDVSVQVLAATTAGVSPYTAADPVILECHDRVWADPTLHGLALACEEGATLRQREGAERRLGSVLKLYTFQYATTEASLE